MSVHILLTSVISTMLIRSRIFNQQVLGPKPPISPFDGIISKCFEQHLNIYIESQDRYVLLLFCVVHQVYLYAVLHVSSHCVRYSSYTTCYMCPAPVLHVSHSNVTCF